MQDNYRCWGVLLIWIMVGKVSIVLAVEMDRGGLLYFLSSIISLFFLLLSERRPNID